MNDDRSGIFVRNFGDVPAETVNNFFVGPGKITSGPAQLAGNVATRQPNFVNRDLFDYRLRVGSPAIDAGVRLGDDMTPRNIYVHPAGVGPRMLDGAVDVGAYEFVP